MREDYPRTYAFWKPNTRMHFWKALLMRQTPGALIHDSSIHLLWQTLPPPSLTTWYPDFCRKGKSGPSIGEDGAGRADTNRPVIIIVYKVKIE